jgi:hypothetical protein
MRWLKEYGETEGPLGFPMLDSEAKSLDALLTQHPEAEYCRAVLSKATAELQEGERADISWISTEDKDRVGDLVLSVGMDDRQYKANPLVTLNHAYYRPPVGKSVWRRRMKVDECRGIQAKTVYPDRPAEWQDGQEWPADSAFALVKSGLMCGKSIGFLALEASGPTEQEVKKNPAWAEVRRVVRKWLLLEYACTWMPVNQAALVEAVSKSLVTAQALRLVGAELPPPPPQRPEPPPERPEPAALVVPFTTEEEVKAAVERRLQGLDLAGLVQKICEEAWNKAKGRV